MRGILGAIVIIWLVIGVAAAVQRGYFGDDQEVSCATAGTAVSTAASTAVRPGLDLAGFDIYDHAVQDDPLPWYAALREQAPLFHNVEHDYWVLSRHEDVHWATREDAGLSNRMGVTLDASAWNEHAHLVMSFLAMDPPETTRLRRLVSRAFTPKRVRELAPTVEALTERYLDEALAEGGSFDWIFEVAGRIPMDVISDMMGVPEADRAEVRRLSDLLVHREDGLRDVPAVGIEASMKLFEYYAGMLADRRRQPTDDLTSALLNAEDESGRMTDAEITAVLAYIKSTWPDLQRDMQAKLTAKDEEGS